MEIIADTLGVILKYQDDIKTFTPETLNASLRTRQTASRHCAWVSIDEPQWPNQRCIPWLPDDLHPYEGGNLLHNLLLFGRLCKGLGMDVNPERMMDAARALEYVGLARRSDVYHTLRAVIVTRQRDLEWFDQAFREFWRRPSEGYTTLDLRSMGEQRYKRKTQFLPPMGSEPDEGDDPR